MQLEYDATCRLVTPLISQVSSKFIAATVKALLMSYQVPRRMQSKKCTMPENCCHEMLAISHPSVLAVVSQQVVGLTCICCSWVFGVALMLPRACSMALLTAMHAAMSSLPEP